jgi:serine protease Do
MIMFRIIVVLVTAALVTPVWAKDYSKLFERLSPAVVTIFTEQSAVVSTSGGAVSTNSQGLGTGVIIDKAGVVLTASHVVNNASRVRVELKDGRGYMANVLSTIPAADLATIQLLAPPTDLVAVAPGNSQTISIGADVFVIGAPYGLKHTFSAGNLSGRRIMEDALFGEDLEFLQTDAAINKGNSGGPMFTGKGALIGIVSHIRSQSGGSEGLGFAASINMARDLILNQSPLWFGMEYLPLNESSLKILNVQGYALGLLVQNVAAGSLGAKLQVRGGTFPAVVQGQNIRFGGDIVVEVGGRKLDLSADGVTRLRQYFLDKQSGDRLEITVIRAGQKILLSTPKP